MPKRNPTYWRRRDDRLRLEEELRQFRRQQATHERELLEHASRAIERAVIDRIHAESRDGGLLSKHRSH